MKPFVGLTADAFATYAPDKWSSNVHNLTRMRVKDSMVALADRAQRGLAEQLSGLERAASDEVPNIANQKKVDSQWVFWFRDAAARTALAAFLEKVKLDQSALLNLATQDKHAALAVVLRQNEVWAGFQVAPGATVDRRNLHAKLAKGWERERLLEVLKALPQGASFGFGAELHPIGEATLATIEAHGEELGHDHTPVWHVGYSINPDKAVAAGESLADEVARWLAAVAPLYRFVAWTRDNDHIEAGKQLQEEKAQKRRQATNFNTGDRVRIISGLFSGKIGVVQETDTKAQVKVRVGKMSVVVQGADLTPAT
jgi:hypothetical protein